VILQKIDEIICNLLTQINTLNIQVNNLNSQIITINSEIINIYNTLDVCCVVTTTTTTTQFVAPCEGFLLTNTGLDTLAIIITDCITGLPEAVILSPGDTEICVETDSPLVVPGTVVATPTGPCNTSTTTTSSSSTTTTTTTIFIACECLTFTNTDSSSHEIEYENCLGNTIATTISANEIIKVCGCCGFSNSELVTISIGGNCVDGECPLILNDCSILINAVNGDIIGYDVDTNQSVVLTTLPFSNDIANTDTKMWLYDNMTQLVSEYDITINPWTSSFNKNISFPAGVNFGAGLGAISNTKLLTTNTLLTPQPIIEVTITGTTSSVTSTIAYLNPGYQISGDILLTTTGKVICLANSGTTNKLLQYDKVTGIKEAEVTINSFIGSEFPLGLVESNSKLYILCSAGSVYKVNLNSPYGLTLANVGDFTVSGASQSPECATVNLIPTTTTTTTTTTSACLVYIVQASTEGQTWEGLSCEDETPVTGPIPYQGPINTECIVNGSLILSSLASQLQTTNCDDCVSYIIGGGFRGGTWEAKDCNGNAVGGSLLQDETIATGCIVSSTLLTTNIYIDTILGPCITTTTTTTTCNPIFEATNYSGVTYRNGDPIPEVTDNTTWANLTTGAWCYYNNDSANEPIYGRMYNWYAVNDPRGFAPLGYHVPSAEELQCLIDRWGGDAVAGGALKEAGTTHWLAPNTGATNTSGFTALPGGRRNGTAGTFAGLNSVGYFWGSDSYGLTQAPFLDLNYNLVSTFVSSTTKDDGISVRLVQD
jgi:uncharacterized protein (TIGR02145 family)